MPRQKKSRSKKKAKAADKSSNAQSFSHQAPSCVTTTMTTPMMIPDDTLFNQSMETTSTVSSHDTIDKSCSPPTTSILRGQVEFSFCGSSVEGDEERFLPRSHPSAETSTSDGEGATKSRTCGCCCSCRCRPQDWSKWLTLLAWAVTSFSASWMGITFSPMAEGVARTWNVSTSAANHLAGVYMYIYALSSFLSLLLMTRYLSLPRGLLWGASVNVLGAVLRYRQCHEYSHVYVGTIVAACAQAFLVGAPFRMVDGWLAKSRDEKASVKSVGLLASQLGAAVGLGATAVVDFYTNGNTNDSGNESDTIDLGILQQYLGAQLALALLGLLLVLVFAKDEPPLRVSNNNNNLSHKLPPRSKRSFEPAPQQVTSQHHPYSNLCNNLNNFREDDELVSIGDESSILLGDAVIMGYCSCGTDDASVNLNPAASGMVVNAISSESLAVVPHYLSFKDSVRKVLLNWRNAFYLISYGFPMGVYYALPVFISQLLTYPEAQNNLSWCVASIGRVGVAFQLASVCGSLLARWILPHQLHWTKRQQEHRYILQSLLGGAALSLLTFLVASTDTTITNGWTTTEEESSILTSCAIVLGLGGSGLCLSASNTVGLLFGGSMSFPANPAVVEVLLESWAKLMGFALVLLGGPMLEFQLIQPPNEENDEESSILLLGRLLFLGILAGVVTFSLSFISLLQPPTKQLPR